MECKSICTDLDMKLGAVVVIMNSAGCVCEPRDKAEETNLHGGTSSIAGGAVIQAVAEAQRQSQAQQRAR